MDFGVLGGDTRPAPPPPLFVKPTEARKHDDITTGSGAIQIYSNPAATCRRRLKRNGFWKVSLFFHCFNLDLISFQSEENQNCRCFFCMQFVSAWKVSDASCIVCGEQSADLSRQRGCAISGLIDWLCRSHFDRRISVIFQFGNRRL